jgi:hypothetical protein
MSLDPEGKTIEVRAEEGLAALRRAAKNAAERRQMLSSGRIFPETLDNRAPWNLVSQPNEPTSIEDLAPLLTQGAGRI